MYTCQCVKNLAVHLTGFLFPNNLPCICTQGIVLTLLPPIPTEHSCLVLCCTQLESLICTNGKDKLSNKVAKVKISF